MLKGDTGFPERLAYLRDHEFLTQRDLHERSGVHFTTIAKLENGKVSPQPKTVLKLAKALGVTPQYLKFGETSPRPLLREAESDGRVAS